jgi:hypothetical protein
MIVNNPQFVPYFNYGMVNMTLGARFEIAETLFSVKFSKKVFTPR